MAAVAAADVPRGTVDDFGGLLREGETPERALRRLEKRRDYTKLIGTDEGQRLLAAATSQVREAPNGGVGTKSRVVAEAPGPPSQIHVAPPSAGVRFMDLDLSLVDVAENVRIDPGELEELTASIAELGVLQPIRAIGPGPDGRYRAVWGQRRILASQAAGRDTIPALVQASADVDAPGARRSIEQLAENLQRKDLNAIEEAVAIRAVLDADPELTQAALAQRLGRSPSWLSNTLRLLDAAPEVQDGVRAGTVTASHAKALVVLPAKDQASLVERIRSGLSAHQLESEISWRTSEAERRRKDIERTEKQVPKAIEALTAGGVEKTTPVVLSYSYNLENDRLEAAIKKAGWKIEHGSWGSGRPKGCDCTAVRLRFERKWQLEDVCVNGAHHDRGREADRTEDTKKREAVKRRVKVLRAHLRPALEELPLPVLLLAHGDTWQLPSQVANAVGLTRNAIVEATLEQMIRRVDPSQVWNDRFDALVTALESLIAMFEPAAEPTDA